MDDALLDGADDAFLMAVFEAGGQFDVDAEVVEAGGWLDFFGGDFDFESFRGELVGVQVLLSVEAGAGAHGDEEELERSHAGVRAAVVFGLVANDFVAAGISFEAGGAEVANSGFDHAFIVALGGEGWRSRVHGPKGSTRSGAGRP